MIRLLAVDSNNLTTVVNQVQALVSRNKLNRIPKSKGYAYNIPVQFDTETTNYTTESGEKVGWLYIWMFRFGNPDNEDSMAIYGRDTTLLDQFLSELQDVLSLNQTDSAEKMVYIYVQNLGFDLEFIRDKLTIISELHQDRHQPIYVRDIRGFEFRDSKILSGGLSLAKIGESLNTSFKKRVGDLDYDLIRTPLTPLTDVELGYCVGDIDVLAQYIQHESEHYHGVQSIPLTNTGRVRKYAKQHISRTSYNAFLRYRSLMDSCVLDYEEYTKCQRAFYGGFTHANQRYVNVPLQNVRSYDFTSSYPAVMLSERYPMGKPTHIDHLEYNDWLDIVNDATKCAIAEIQLQNVFIKDDVGDCYLSNDPDKTHVLNPEIDNGRIRSCEQIAITITDVDFKIINQAYTWDEISIDNVLVWENNYLPSLLIDVVLDLYNAKTTLKGVPKRVEEYQVKKGMLNSLYGMCVTRILRDKISINGDNWVKTLLTDDEKRENIDKNNNSKNRFLYYPWGVFITAYQRFNLWTAIKELGDDYIYADTDSIKVFQDSAKIDGYLEKYHHDLNLKFQWMLEKRRKFSMDDLRPKTRDGIEKPIGVWDYEGCYEWFKTLGAKRYIKYENGQFYPTVQGISPKKLGSWIASNSHDPESGLSLFCDGLYVPAEKTGKLQSFYYQDVDMIVTDYLGCKCHIQQKYGVHLQPVDFTLTMSGTFLDLIKQLQKVI